MGNTLGAIDFEYKISVNDYKPIQKIKDPRLGELIQMKNQDTERVVMMKEKIIKDSDTYRKAIEESVNHMALKHKNLVRVHGFAGADSQEKNKARIYVYFEYLSNTLQGEINAKKLSVAQKGSGAKASSKYFTEQNLYKIAAEVIDALEYLQQNSMSHGEIKPDACYIAKSGVIKILDKQLVGDTTSAFEMVKGGDRSYFLTPKAFECIKKKLNEPMEDKYRADVFSLGLSMLECATLKPSSQIYDWNNYTINLTLLSNRLMEVKERYSAGFYNLVRGMVRIEEEQRPDFIYLKNQLAEEGWINPYATTSPNYSDEEVIPELNEQVEAITISGIQTKGLKDSKLNTLSSPTNSATKANKIVFPNTSSATKGASLANIAQIQKKFIEIQDSSLDDTIGDVPPSERVYNVNKVPHAVINRSAVNMKSQKALMTQSATTSLQEMVLSRNQVSVRPRDTAASNRTMVDSSLVNNKIKNKFSKLQGNFSKTSKPTLQQQAPQSFEIPQHLQSGTKSTKSKSIFDGKPQFNKQQSSTVDYSSDANPNENSFMGYQYDYEGTPANRNFNVEDLLQETLQRSAKHTYFIPESFNQPTQYHSKSDKPPAGNSRIFDPLSQRHSAMPMPRVNPFAKSKPSLTSNVNHSIEQGSRGNITQNGFPSSKISFREDDSHSELTYFAPDAGVNGFSSPHGRPDDFISYQNSFLEFDSVRASHRPIVVDMVDNSHGFNKSLIDSIVRSEASSAKPLGNIGNSPFGKGKDFPVPKSPICMEGTPKEPRKYMHHVSPRVTSNIKPLAKNELRDDKILLDTSLEEDLDNNHNQKDAYVYSRNVSTKEEFAPQESGSGQLNMNKQAEEEEDLDDRIQKALERSRQTYLFTTAAFNNERKDVVSLSNPSENRFSDILSSNNGINDQVVMGYEMSENKFSQLSEIQG